MRLLTIAMSVIVTASLIGCSIYPQRSGSSSSLVDYLYPDGQIPPEVGDEIPIINVPARVGLAFVPGSGWANLGEHQRSELLEIVKARFADREFIERIEIIPTTYLQQKGGFDGLRQIGRLYSVDLVALVSYDQVVSTGDNAASLLYWTIVGAYVIKGTEHDVSTFVDTAVFDLNSRRMLFRAPGLDQREASSTAIKVAEARSVASDQSFAAAMNQMTENLDQELESFRERIKQDQSVRVVGRDGSSGAGSVDIVLLLLLLIGILVSWRKVTS